MPLVPERKASRQEIKAAINGQFWELPVHSTRYLDGVAWNLPCEPPPLTLIGSSGLSRSQQLIAAQAVGVPALPSYDGNSDGLVFDRVLAKFGGRSWWTAFTGRTKIQKIFVSASNSSHKVDALRDLDNYAVSGRGRFQLGRRVTLNGTIEMPDVHKLYQLISGHTHNLSTTSPSISLVDNVAYHASLKCEIPGHDVTANVGCNVDYADSSGDYARIPLAVSVDLSSLDRGDGLQYKVGLHQVSAPLTEYDGGTTPHGTALNTVLHAQGAVAVEGEAYMWKGGSSAPLYNTTAKSAAVGAGSGDQGTRHVDDNQVAVGGSAAGGVDNELASSSSSQTIIAKSLASASAADQSEEEEKEEREQEEEEEAALKQMSSSVPGGTGSRVSSIASANDGTTHGDAANKISEGDNNGHHNRLHESLEQFIRPLEDIGHAIHESIHLPIFGKCATDAEDVKVHEEARSLDKNHHVAPNRIVPIAADSIASAIHDSLATLTRVRDSVAKATTNVQDGSLQRLSEQLSRKPSGRKRPYSMLLGQPYLKCNAAMGCLARMPLPTLLPVGPSATSNTSGGGLRYAGLGRHNASTSSLASASSQLAEAWEPYLKGTALRVFASASISGQIGRFSRRFLDYTAGVLRLDVGLSSPHVVGAQPGSLDGTHRPDKHRAFALEGRGSWHALSASVTQQLYGPIRARADFRFALDPTNVPQDQGERSTLKGLAQTALSVRPSLLEAVYGFDAVLPGTEGAGRVAVWWSPKRKEAMAELRLF